jgi:putative transcriptional regulator
MKIVTCLAALLVLGLPPSLNLIAKPPLMEKGMFLVASDSLSQTPFSHTVIFITHYHVDDGAMGVTINRATGKKVSELFPNLKGFNENSGQLFAGGPVQPGALLILARSKKDDNGMERIVADIHFASGLVNLAHILKSDKDRKSIRTYSGYAGWAPGQLEEEISRGDWLVVPADPTLIFDSEPDTVWEKLQKNWAGVWM